MTLHATVTLGHGCPPIIDASGRTCVNAQGSLAAAEVARQNANADASRLRADLATLTAERDSLAHDLIAFQKEVQQ